MSYELTKAILTHPIGDHIAQHLLATMATYCDHENTECWPSLARLSTLSGIPLRTVNRKIAWLLKHRYLSKKYDNGHNIYHISIIEFKAVYGC